MVVAYHLGGRLECGRRWLGGNLAQFEMGGISGFLFRNRYPDFTIDFRDASSLPSLNVLNV